MFVSNNVVSLANWDQNYLKCSRRSITRKRGKKRETPIDSSSMCVCTHVCMCVLEFRKLGCPFEIWGLYLSHFSLDAKGS